jgi:hypothetical protein
MMDLKELLEGRGGHVFEERLFPFYGVLLYTPTNGLNKLLHDYIISHFELFNAQTGPNWLVAVVEDINRNQSIEKFKPQDVYEIARFLGAPVDAIPAIVFFTEPKVRNETLVLRLKDFLPESSGITDEDLTGLFGKLATKIDNVCQRSSPNDSRLKSLNQAIKKEWTRNPSFGERLSYAGEGLKTSAAAAPTVFHALNNIVEFLMKTGLISGG